MKITCMNITKKFDHRILLKDINYTFESGKLYCIQGNSGSGKTTLLHMLGLLEPVSSGKILYNNKEIKKREKLYTSTVSFLFQDFALIENETVKYNLEILPCIRKINKKSVCVY